MKRLLTAGILTTTIAGSLAAATTSTAASTDRPGPGWTAAIQHQTSADDNQGNLVMVRPTGGILAIGEVSDDARIQDVSADGRHVITSREQGGQTRVTVWDTSTKAPTYFRTAEYTDLQFGGGGVVEMPEADESTFTVREFDGTVRGTYETQPPTSEGYSTSAVTPDGAHVVETSGPDLAVRDAATGHVIKEVDQPEPERKDRACTVDRAWGNDAVVVSCGSTEGLDSRNHYRVDLDGTATIAEKDTFGTVWPTASGTANGGIGNAVSQWRFTSSSGEVSDLPLGDSAAVGGSDATRLYVVSQPYEGTDSELYTYDVTTGGTTTLAGTEETGGGVITAAYTIDGTR